MAAVRLRWCVAAAIAGLALAGCGGSSNEQSGAGTNGRPTAPIGGAAHRCGDATGGVRQLRVTNAECAYAQGIVVSWTAKRACQAPAGGSRASCTVGSLRCLGARTDQGIAVTCAQRGRSVSFVARPD